MSLEKSIKSGREKRKIFYDSRSVDGSCRNHGNCPYCTNGRMHNTNKKLINMKEMQSEFS